MAPSLLLLGSFLATLAEASPAPPELAAQLLRRQDTYANSVCSPNVTDTDSLIPPCIEITTIEEACAPNGTAEIYYIAHAECMCGGSYFAEWTGCQDCLFYHGQRTEQEEEFYSSVAAEASHSLCDFLSSSGSPTPTTDFAAIFSSVEATVASPTTGGTVSSDQASGSTAVSLYFTFTGEQGPGPITGSAATATATTTEGATASGSGSESGSASGATSTTKSSSNTSSKSSASGTAASGSASSSSSGSGAQPTNAPGGLLLGLAGLALAAGL